MCKFVFEDEIGNSPIREYIMDCDISKSELEDMVSIINGNKWKKPIDYRILSNKIRGLKKCQLLKTKNIVVGGYSGGPLGNRTFTFPAIYEFPSDTIFDEPDAEIKCKQEGAHIICSLNDPEIL